MPIKPIKYLLINFDTMQWTAQENYDKFIHSLSNIDLSILDPTLQEKAKELLAKPSIPKIISVNQNYQPEIQNPTNQGNKEQMNKTNLMNNISKIIVIIGIILTGASLYLPSLDVGGVSTNINSILDLLYPLIVCIGIFSDNATLKKAVFLLIFSEIYSFYKISNFLDEFPFAKIQIGIISDFVGAILITVSAIISSLYANKVNKSGIK